MTQPSLLRAKPFAKVHPSFHPVSTLAWRNSAFYCLDMSWIGLEDMPDLLLPGVAWYGLIEVSATSKSLLSPHLKHIFLVWVLTEKKHNWLSYHDTQVLRFKMMTYNRINWNCFQIVTVVSKLSYVDKKNFAIPVYHLIKELVQINKTKSIFAFALVLPGIW